MSQTSNKVKQNWNAKHYKQIKVNVKPDLADAFACACADSNMSMSKAISEFMASFCEQVKAPQSQREDNTSPGQTLSMTTRGKRRKIVKKLIAQLNDILVAETAYRDKIPENLQGSLRYENAEESIQIMENAINSLSEAYDQT